MNRIKFGAEGMVKSLHPIPVLEKVYPQRYLIKNKEKIEYVRARVVKIKDMIDKMKASRAHFTSQESGNILQALTTLTSQIKPQEPSENPLLQTP